jgi:DNA-binding transcriptional MerR regulator
MSTSNNLRLPVLPKPGSSSSSVGSVAASAGTQGDLELQGNEAAEVDEAEQGLMQIGDLAREAGKTVRAVHLYEELDLLKPAARSKGRYRLYDADALVRIRWIGKLQEMGFSLSDIQTVVRDWEHQGTAPRAMVRMREVYKKKLEETRAQIKKLEALEHEMEASLRYLDTCEVCEPERLLSACTHCDRHDCSDKAPDLVAGFRAQRLVALPGR